MRRFVWIVVAVACVAAVREPETAFRLRLIAQDQEGRRHSIIFGVDPAATYGYDEALGEQPVPPSPPPGIFDFRFKDLPGHRRVPADGAYMDIRQALSTPAQCDTFLVNCQAATSRYPMTIALDRHSASGVDSLIIQPVLSGSCDRLDLLKVGTYLVTSDESTLIRIIMYTHRRTDK